MNDERHEPDLARYEPPALVVVGYVEDLTQQISDDFCSITDPICDTTP